MNNNFQDHENALNEGYLAKLVSAMEVDAVVKTEFMSFLSGLIEYERVFAFEGPEDKTIYSYWLSRSRAELTYESFVCKNKVKTLQLFDTLQSDLTGLSEFTYFFVDRDFDGLQGREEASNLFLTDKYSIENYLVGEDVLENLLRNDFHCDDQQTRTNVLALFRSTYERFLLTTKDLNFRIYISRRFQIEQLVDLPTSINTLARVSLNDVAPCDELPVHLELAREPDQSELETATAEFSKLNAVDDYRGKFALLFFSKWLGLLRQDRLAENPSIFSLIPKAIYNVRGDFSFHALAPRAPSPEGLNAFLFAVA